MIIVIDTCIAVKWFVEEDHHDEALSLTSKYFKRIAPSFLLVETANTFRRKILKNEMSIAQARSAIQNIRLFFSDLIDTSEIIETAFEYSIELTHPVADCLYLALAIKNNAILVTSDKKFATKVQKTSMNKNIHLLSDGHSNLISKQLH